MLAFDLGMHRYIFNGNWKLQVENVLDSYHVPFGHASTVNKDGVQFARREGDKSGAKVVEADQAKTAQSWKGPMFRSSIRLRELLRSQRKKAAT